MRRSADLKAEEIEKKHEVIERAQAWVKQKKENKQEEQRQANAQSLAEWTANCEARDAKLEEEQARREQRRR